MTLNEVSSYIGALLGIRRLEDIPQNIYRSVWLDSNACQHAVVVDISYQFFGTCLLVGRVLGALGSTGESSLVVEAV